MGNHDVFDAVTLSDATPANSFETLADIFPAGSPNTPLRLLGITNVNPAFTPKNRPRQNYDAKGVDVATKYGESLVLSWDHEVVRGDDDQFLPDLQELIDASRAVGLANRRRIRVYDAFGADEAFEAFFAISITRTGTGWDDAQYKTVTATQQGKVSYIANPVLTGIVPLVTRVTPSAAVAGTVIYVEGSNFAGATGVKFGATAGTNVEVVSDTLIVVTVAGTAGSKPITVTTAGGTSEPVPFTIN